MNEKIKARLRLHMLSERAMGLPAISGGSVAPSGAGEAELPEAAAVCVASPAPESDARPKAQSFVPAPLFGANEIPPTPGKGVNSDPTSAGLNAPPLATDEKRRQLIAMDENEVRGCTKCRLCQTRTHTVFGEGDVDAPIFFIGEGPGETEDQTGRPFVGRAGELLNKMIVAMGLARGQVMISNIVKCRPPNNRVPAPDEVATCTPYLMRQLEIVRPRAIVTLGLPATQYMLNSKVSMGKMRGQWHDWRGIKLMPTYHPAYVLRNPSVETRGAVWSDLKQVLAEIGLPLPRREI